MMQISIRPRKKPSYISGSLPEKNRVGRLALLFFLLTVQNSSFPSSSPKMYMQCHQAVDPGDMYYGISEVQRSQNASLGHPLTGLNQVLIISSPIIIGVYAVGGGGGFCQRLSAVSHNTVSFESMSML